MAGEDHLDKETSLSVNVTEAGVTASAKSRTISAWDRLGGNLAEYFNVRLEQSISKRRAKMDGERKLIEAAAAYGVERIGKDPLFAERALEHHHERVVRQQANADGVLAEAMEELRSNPPSADEATTGPEDLSEPFFGRFEHYAREASTDELRQRWGRVLASEIRRPGTFSARVLRIVDELDAQTALLFEEMCLQRLPSGVPKALFRELSFDELRALVEANLVIEPGIAGHSVTMGTAVIDGRKVYAVQCDNYMLMLPADELGQASDSEKELIKIQDGVASLDVYALTEVGRAVANILPWREKEVLAAIGKRLGEGRPTLGARLYRRVGTDWAPVG